jgi:hypothetical protein
VALGLVRVGLRHGTIGRIAAGFGHGAHCAALAQATSFLAVSPKSDAAGRAYFAALDDVLTLGAQPVPLHLRNAGDRRMKHHGIGVGYRNPHEFEGHDVAQQYLPDMLIDRRYYVPSDQGLEARIGDRLDRLREDRGRPLRRAHRLGPAVDGMSVGGRAMKARSEAMREIAGEEKSEADAG